VAVKRIYIAGPMRGYDNYNFPAFFAAEEHFGELGYLVLNPARMDMESGQPVSMVTLHDRRSVVRRDLNAILDADEIALLYGWQGSDGATAERRVARWLKLPVWKQKANGRWFPVD
jgi:uncharacterized protein DUF4406